MTTPKTRKQDPQLLAIARVRRILNTLPTANDQMQVIEFVGRAIFNQQQADQRLKGADGTSTPGRPYGGPDRLVGGEASGDKQPGY